MKFHIGQNSLDVCKTIVEHNNKIRQINLVYHGVGINWRQRHKTPEQKMDHLNTGLKHYDPTIKVEYSREKFLNINLKEIESQKNNHVWSITSKVKCTDRKIRHIPMMNFHPESDSNEIIKKSVTNICRNKSGVLLDSGRFQHYYGDFLLDEDEWIEFLSAFLMPTILVIPRYIGHVLHRGYCTLRLTSDDKYKPYIPKVIEVL